MLYDKDKSEVFGIPIYQEFCLTNASTGATSAVVALPNIETVVCAVASPTWSFVPGAVVPMPTLPSDCMVNTSLFPSSSRKVKSPGVALSPNSQAVPSDTDILIIEVAPTAPLICNFVAGSVVPMPTLPVLSILIRSLYEVAPVLEPNTITPLY